MQRRRAIEEHDASHLLTASDVPWPHRRGLHEPRLTVEEFFAVARKIPPGHADERLTTLHEWDRRGFVSDHTALRITLLLEHEATDVRTPALECPTAHCPHGR